MSKTDQFSFSNKLIELGIDGSLAKDIETAASHYIKEIPAEECWQKLVDEFLASPKINLPFEIHEFLYKTLYPDWSLMPRAAWLPKKEIIEESNIAKVLANKSYSNYKSLHRWSVTHSRDFWHMMVHLLSIVFDKPYTAIVEFKKNNGVNSHQQDLKSSKHELEDPSWFVDGKLNIVKSCFATQQESRRSDIAIISQNEQGVVNQTTYEELNELSSQIARGISKRYKKGEKIAILMPMNKNAIAIYLAVIKAGCVAVSIAESFSTEEIIKRVTLSEAKAIFTQMHIQREGKIISLYDRIATSSFPPAIVMGAEISSGETHINRLRENDLSYDNFIADCTHGRTSTENNGQAPDLEDFEPLSCKPDDYITILFSSGTTGDPKAIPWNHTTPIKCASDAYWHHDLKQGDIFCWPTSLGWMMGPWLIFATLINKATIAIFEGSPTSKKFGQFIQDTGVTHLGVVPTMVKSWRNSGCMLGFNWQKIKLFTSTGECSNIIDMLYLMYLANYRPIIEYCGGTEIGGGYITGTVVDPCAPAAFTCAAMGIDFVIIDEQGNLCDSGEVALIGPSIGLTTTLLNQDHHQVYYADMPKLYSNIELLEQEKTSQPEENKSWKDKYLSDRNVSIGFKNIGLLLRRHGDHVQHFPNGFYRLHGRIDDTMNLSGIKVGSAEIERVLNNHPAVRETAAIAVQPAESGPSQLVIYAEIPDEVNLDELKIEMQALLKQHLNPLFKIHKVIKIDALPRTASNKVVRRILREQWSMAK